MAGKQPIASSHGERYRVGYACTRCPASFASLLIGVRLDQRACNTLGFKGHRQWFLVPTHEQRQDGYIIMSDSHTFIVHGESEFGEQLDKGCCMTASPTNSVFYGRPPVRKSYFHSSIGIPSPATRLAVA